jgi:hypothetical protein
MSRIKLLIVAVVVAVASGSYLSSTGKREVTKVRAYAERQLTSAQAAMTPTLKQVAAEQLAAVKTLGANVEIAQAFDDANKPTAAALEVAVSALSKLEGEAAKPDLLLLISGGAAARYRVGATNRFDKDDSAFKVVGPVGEAHGLSAVLDGEAFQIAAAPLVLTGDPAPAPIGQVVLGYALNDGFAMRLSKAAGADVSIIADKKIIASTLPPADKKALPTSARAGSSLDFGDLTGDSYSFFGLAKLPLGVEGSASQHAIAVSLGGDAIAVLSARVANGYADIAADQKQILEFTAGIILLCLVLLFGSNPTKGLSEVASVADKIAQGDLSLRAPTERVARDVRRLAVAVNAITANAAARRPPAGSAAGSSPSVALGQPKPAAIEDKPVEPLRQTAPPPAPEPSRQSSPPPPEPKPDFREPSFSGLFGAQPSTAKAAGPGRRDDDFGDIFDSQPPPPSSPPKPLMQPPPPPPPAPAAGVQPMFQEDPDAFNPDATVVAQVPEALVRATRASAGAGSHPAPSRDAVPMAVPLPPATPANTEETHFQSVYREFVATRERCGEPADGLTYDKFVAKLRKNKDQLVAKYACKSVKFQVYVKDGKAALKATPVRE